MKSMMGSLAVALLLFAGGFALWVTAGRQLRLAEAQRDLALLRFEQAAAAFDELAADRGLAGLVPGLDAGPGARQLGALSRYWLGSYDAATTDDPAMAFLAANAAYRSVEREGGAWSTVVGRLDTVVKRFADVVRSDPGNEDAAFNYEFAVRRRAAIAASKQKVPPVNPAQSGRTLHGDAGAPPAGSDMKQFKMIVPMLPQERLEAEQAGRGTRRIRKG
jgi:hypothetical protein